jgi:hypothetical protein
MPSVVAFVVHYDTLVRKAQVPSIAIIKLDANVLPTVHSESHQAPEPTSRSHDLDPMTYLNEPSLHRRGQFFVPLDSCGAWAWRNHCGFFDVWFRIKDFLVKRFIFHYQVNGCGLRAIYISLFFQRGSARRLSNSTEGICVF